MFLLILLGKIFSQNNSEEYKLNTFTCGGVINHEDVDFAKSKINFNESEYIFSAQAIPQVVKKDDHSIKLMIGIKDTNVVSVAINVPSATHVEFNNSKVDKIILYDDGTHGDSLQGDNIFTTNNIFIGSSFGPFYTPNEVFWYYYFQYENNITLTYNDNTEKDIVEKLGISIILVNDDYGSNLYVNQLSDSVFATDNIVNIVLNRNEEFPSFYTDLNHIGEIYHSYFRGDRDFLIVASIYSHSSSSAGFYYNLKNTIEGIGKSIYDITDRISDNTVLQGITNISHSTIIFFSTINHELLHRWATSLYEVPNLEGPSWHRHHWDIVRREESGFGASGHVVSKIEKVSDSTYKTTEIERTNNYYNDLELYLMGLAPFSDIESPIETLVNPQKNGGIHPNYLYTADSIRYIV